MFDVVRHSCSTDGGSGVITHCPISSVCVKFNDCVGNVCCTNLNLLTLLPLMAAHTHTLKKGEMSFVRKGRRRAAVCVCAMAEVSRLLCLVVCLLLWHAMIMVTHLWASLHVCECSHTRLLTWCHVHACLNSYDTPPV